MSFYDAKREVLNVLPGSIFLKNYPYASGIEKDLLMIFYRNISEHMKLIHDR